MFSITFDQYNAYNRLFIGKFYGDKLPHMGWQNVLHVCSVNCIWSIMVEMFSIFSSQECIVCVYTETAIQKQTHKQSSLKGKIWQPVLHITISTSQYSNKSCNSLLIILVQNTATMNGHFSISLHLSWRAFTSV